MTETNNVERLIHVILVLDQYLPHNPELRPEIPDDVLPAWCPALKAALKTPGGECCNMCAELSEITIRALNEAFSESRTAKEVSSRKKVDRKS